MAVEVWLTAALVILATVCIGLGTGLFSLPILGDSIPFLRGPRDFILDRLARFEQFHSSGVVCAN